MNGRRFDPSKSFPLPPRSLQHHFDHVQESQPRRDARDLLFTVLLSLLFAVPLICAGIIIHFR